MKGEREGALMGWREVERSEDGGIETDKETVRLMSKGREML